MFKEILEQEKFQFLQKLKRTNWDKFKDDFIQASKIVYNGFLNKNINPNWNIIFSDIENKEGNIIVLNSGDSKIKIKNIKSEKTDTLNKYDIGSFYKKEQDNKIIYFIKYKNSDMLQEFNIMK